jgi:putative transposase
MRARGFRVESICAVLSEQGVQVAPRTYRNWKTAAPSARTVADARVTDALRATIGTPEGMYGRRKMTAYLRRQGHRVATCTVDRLMRDEGLSGVIRGRRHRTTIAGGKDSRRAPDLLDRDFNAEAPRRVRGRLLRSNLRRPSRRRLNHDAGIKPGTVQSARLARARCN